MFITKSKDTLKISNLTYMAAANREHLQSASANLEWFPRLRCMSLNIEEPEQEQNEIKELQKQLIETMGLVKNIVTSAGRIKR